MSEKLVRDTDLFWVSDLAWRAAVKVGMDPNEPRLKPADYTVDKTRVTFVASGSTVQLDELGLGKLYRVDDLFTEYVDGLSDFARTHVSPDLPFAYSPSKAEWYFKESAKERLFEKWAGQLGTGANTFVL
ncbi:MAG: hypothetical protein AAB690_01190 [Patescibacteria group bacterium]|mgnify:CR=1 FL=1